MKNSFENLENLIPFDIKVFAINLKEMDWPVCHTVINFSAGFYSKPLYKRD